MSSPAEVAAAAATAPRPLLVAVDVDGTLSFIVSHPADAVLVPGAGEALARVAALDGVTVAVVSGRPLHELRVQCGCRPDTRLRGSHGLEVAVRSASKGPAVERLRAQTSAATVVYVGDDMTDESVLVGLRPPDIGVKVGDLPSAAPYRLDGPADVVQMLEELAQLLSGVSR